MNIIKTISDLDLEAKAYMFILQLKESKTKKYSHEECDPHIIYLFKDYNGLINYFESNGITNIDEKTAKLCIYRITAKGTIIAPKGLCDQVIRNALSQTNETIIEKEESIESQYFDILGRIVRKVDEQLKLLQADKNQLNKSSNGRTKIDFLSKLAYEAIKRTFSHSKIKVNSNQNKDPNTITGTISTSHILQEMELIEAHYQNILNKLLIITFLLIKQSPIINQFLKLIYETFEETDTSISFIMENDEDELIIDSYEALIARLESFDKEKGRKKVQIIGQFIHSIKELLDEEEKELLKYFNEDGTYTGYGTKNKLIELIKRLIEKTLELEQLMPNENEMIEYMKEKIKELIDIISSTYEKKFKKTEEFQITERQKFHDQYPPFMSTTDARSALKEYYDEATESVIQTPEDMEMIKRIVIQCGYREQKKQQIITLFEYRFKYDYLSDEEFDTFYKALESQNPKIEAIINNIEEFHSFLKDEEEPDEQEGIKKTIKELIEELKPLIDNEKATAREQITQTSTSHQRRRKQEK